LCRIAKSFNCAAPGGGIRRGDGGANETALSESRSAPAFDPRRGEIAGP
jgi:hypothetical protein